MRKGKYLRRRMVFVNIPMCAAMVLLWLVFVTTYLACGLYAKYSTTSGGSDSARVIAFRNLTVTENGDFDKKDGKNEFIFLPGVDMTKDIEVSFDGSEADCFVFVKIEAPGWNTDNHVTFIDSRSLMSWAVNVGTTEAPVWQHLSSDGSTHVYYQILESNEVLDPCDVISEGKVYVNEAVGDNDMRALYKACTDAIGTNPININVTAYAVQANGFESVSAAWTSLNGH